jgi:hypothetical protein
MYTKEIGDGGGNERGVGVGKREGAGEWNRERSVFRGEDWDERLRLIAAY